MHDAHAVAVVEGPQQLVEVAADVVVSQGLEDRESVSEGLEDGAAVRWF